MSWWYRHHLNFDPYHQYNAVPWFLRVTKQLWSVLNPLQSDNKLRWDHQTIIHMSFPNILSLNMLRLLSAKLCVRLLKLQFKWLVQTSIRNSSANVFSLLAIVMNGTKRWHIVWIGSSTPPRIALSIDPPPWKNRNWVKISHYYYPSILFWNMHFQLYIFPRVSKQYSFDCEYSECHFYCHLFSMNEENWIIR